jgi:hypothetical protein
MGGVAILRFVVPQAEPALDWWVLASTAIFSSTGREVSAAKLLSGPGMPVTDVIGGSGVCDVGVDA